MCPGFAWDFIPGFDWFERYRFFEGCHQHFAIHIFAGWQAKESEYGWANIQQAGPVKPFVRSHPGAFATNNSEMPMLDRRSGWFRRNVPRAQMIRMKTVIA